MRILYAHYLTDPHHPAVDMVERISDELRLRGHEVYVHASAGLEEATTGRRLATAHEMRGWIQSIKDTLWFAKACWRNRHRVNEDRVAITGFNPDIVLTRQDAYCFSVVKAATELEIPVVTYADAPVAYESRMFDGSGRWHPPCLVEWIERWGLEKSQRIITVSRPAKQRLSRYAGVAPIEAIPNGVSPGRFPEVSASQRHSIRRELGIDDKVVIGFQGTFKAFHGIDRLREIMQQLSDQQDVAWLLVGDGPEREKLENSVANENVVFTGRVPSEDIGRYLSAMDVAIAPHAQFEGDFYFCPLKILEYAASGIPVVASNQGDISLLLDGGRAGMIVDHDEPSIWADAVRELIADSCHRMELSQRARRHVLENHTWKHTAMRVEGVLLDALDRGPAFDCQESCPLVTADEEELVEV